MICYYFEFFLAIIFNSRYFLEGLKNIDSEEIFIEFTTNINPCIIRPADEVKYTYLLLLYYRCPRFTIPFSLFCLLYNFVGWFLCKLHNNNSSEIEFLCHIHNFGGLTNMRLCFKIVLICF